MKIKKDEEIPLGWVKGYRKWNEVERQKNKLLKQEERKIIQQKKVDKMKDQTIKIFKEYIDSDYKSLNSFANDKFDKSLVTLTKRFIKYIDGYKKVSKQGRHNLKKELKILWVCNSEAE